LNFKRRFSPKDLNSIEFKGRFQVEIGSNLVSIEQGIFSKYFWAFLQGFEDKTKAKMMSKTMKRLLLE
jgi:hypothetical protein